MNIRNIRIGQRLTIGFGLVIALLAVLAGIALMRIQSLSNDITQLIDQDYPRSILAHRIKADVNEVSRSMLSILIMTEPGQIEEELKKVDKYTRSSEDLLKQLQQSVKDDEGVKLMADITKVRDKAKKSQNAFVGLVKENLKEDAMTKFLFSIRPAHTRYFDHLDKLVALQEANMVASGKRSTDQSRKTEAQILVVTLIAVSASLGIALFSTRSITRPLNRAVQVAQQVANGDLTANISSQSEDETGQLMRALDHMNRSLQQIVGNVRQGTQAIASA